jgi:small subunit ribosomal protein S5
MVRATLDALSRCNTPGEVAAKRGKSVEDIFN